MPKAAEVSAQGTQEFRTADLFFAAFLRVAQVPFLRTARDESERRVYFYFENSGGLRDLRNQYFNRVAQVVAKDFAEEIRTLKTLIHMDQDG